MTTTLKLIALVTLLTCSACARTPNIPTASLTFAGFSQPGDPILYVKLESDQNLSEVFNIYEQQNQNMPKFVCALDHDNNFDVNHTIKARGIGLLEADTKPGKSGKFYFRSSLSFNTTEEKEVPVPMPITSGAALENLLAGQESIPCQVYVTAYGFKAYYTDTVYIPTANLVTHLKEMNHAAEQR
ncbi:hypothetical protein [Pseudomonas viridiflava]|uniref:hypothetical protein n=1 Tax=Pseudomonas viridiflava TaxID=33069 RepID=UPI000F010D42|nr:hypothetical protein [Pseudomonas viridiflava]MBI6680513.1 hypothetical protein [Pseudomonas viridiflava]MEE4105069.1 hypothetical protein [Pseudomonas viridiflava]MEE4151433.1 hypothetical protein [Pseudomonas viridiflava]